MKKSNLVNEFVNLTFDQVVINSSKIILMHLMNGDFKTGVYQACEMVARWAQLQSEKKSK